MRHIVIPAACAVMLGLFAGCGPKKAAPGRMEDPAVHVSQGKRLLNRGDVGGALGEFQRAQRVDPNYAPAIAGLALVAVERKNWSEAEQYIQQAKAKDPRCVDAFVARIRLLSRQQAGASWFLQREDWITQVDSEAQLALRASPNNEEVLHYYGVAQKRALRFDDAARSFGAVVAQKGEFSERADNEWKLVQKIQRAAPQSRMGKKVALVDELTRSELAALFVDEMKLEEVLQKRTPIRYDAPQQTTLTPGSQTRMPSDIGGHWAESFIRDAVRLGALDTKPDGKFNPDQAVTRADFAYLCQNMIVLITQDETLLTRFIAEARQFRDIRPDIWYANAVGLVASRGIMTGDTITGQFNPTGTITGADAILMIRELQNALQIRF